MLRYVEETASARPTRPNKAAKATLPLRSPHTTTQRTASPLRFRFQSTVFTHRKTLSLASFYFVVYIDDDEGAPLKEARISISTQNKLGSRFH